MHVYFFPQAKSDYMNLEKKLEKKQYYADGITIIKNYMNYVTYVC